ncbi:MAG: hypothetical protein Q4E06_03275 [Lautropia sp.]|nr:hypothetical protein [Lautropia sp.]
MQKTMARQMLVVVLGPMLVLPLFAVMRDTEGLALLLVLAVMLLVELAAVAAWYRLDIEKLRGRGRYRDGGAAAFLVVGALMTMVAALPAWQAWRDGSVDTPASSLQVVRGEIEAAPAEVRQGRRHARYLQVGGVLLSCHYLSDDDCAPVRRHAGRMAEIRFQPGLRGQNVVYGVQVDGRVLRTHEDAVAHYRAWRWRVLQRLGLILLLITLPHVWMGWRARTFMRRQPTGAAA